MCTCSDRRHRIAAFGSGEVTKMLGVALTSVARTICDLAADSAGAAERSFQEALYRKIVTLGALAEVLQREPRRPGAPGVVGERVSMLTRARGVWTSLPPDFAAFGPQRVRAELPSPARSPLLSSARPGPEARTHLGMMVPGFPWMFIMYGPNTDTSGGSIIVYHEAQARYIRQAFQLVERHGGEAVEVEAASDRETEARVAGTAWTRCNSWYRDQGGRIVANSRGYIREYERRTHELDPAEYRFVEPPRRVAA